MTSPRALRRVALNLYDWAHCLGAQFTFLEWRKRFAVGCNRVAANRRFWRNKRSLRRAGVSFVCTGDGLAFSSVGYMRSEALRILGAPEDYEGRKVDPPISRRLIEKRKAEVLAGRFV